MPIIPDTKFITIGGMVASDAHSKTTLRMGL